MVGPHAGMWAGVPTWHPGTVLRNVQGCQEYKYQVCIRYHLFSQIKYLLVILFETFENCTKKGNIVLIIYW